MFSAWRKYAFLEQSAYGHADFMVPTGPEKGKAATVPLHKLDITCCAGGRGRLLFGDAAGAIYAFNPNLQCIMWQAYDGE